MSKIQCIVTLLL